MTLVRSARRLSTVAGVALIPLLAAAPAWASHESSNHLTFDSVNSSTADGRGTIVYVKGASDGTEDGSVWQQSLRFTGLTAGTDYSVVVKKGQDAGTTGTTDRTICTFTATASGTGTCTGRFLELRALAVAQLKDATGIVAQATRTGAPNPSGGTFSTAAPGEITSSGDCREPEQGASQCTAPGR